MSGKCYISIDRSCVNRWKGKSVRARTSRQYYIPACPGGKNGKHDESATPEPSISIPDPLSPARDGETSPITNGDCPFLCPPHLRISHVPRPRFSLFRACRDTHVEKMSRTGNDVLKCFGVEEPPCTICGFSVCEKIATKIKWIK